MPLSKVDFANILFAGPCNRWCPDCIGHHLPARVNRSNLEQFPPEEYHRIDRRCERAAYPPHYLHRDEHGSAIILL